MNVNLMADVPNEFILGSIENVVERQGQLDNAQIGPKMAAVSGQNGDQFMPDLLGKLLQLRQRQFLDVQRRVHHFQISAHKIRVVAFSSFQVLKFQESR